CAALRSDAKRLYTGEKGGSLAAPLSCHAIHDRHRRRRRRPASRHLRLLQQVPPWVIQRQRLDQGIGPARWALWRRKEMLADIPSMAGQALQAVNLREKLGLWRLDRLMYHQVLCVRWRFRTSPRPRPLGRPFSVLLPNSPATVLVPAPGAPGPAVPGE